MRKVVFGVIGTFALVALLSGCSENSADDGGGGGVAEPAASELETYEGSAPTTSAEAKEILVDAATAFKSLAESQSSSSVVGPSSIAASQTETERYNDTIDETISGNPSGSVDLNGSVSGETTFNSPSGGGAGEYQVDSQIKLVLDGTFDQFGAQANGSQFVIDGSMQVDTSIDVDLEATVTESSTVTGSYSYSYVYGLVYGVTISDTTNGVGGKFVLYVNESLGESGEISENSSNPFEAIDPQFNGTLEVYNNNDELLFEETLTDSEVRGLFPFVSETDFFS